MYIVNWLNTRIDQRGGIKRRAKETRRKKNGTQREKRISNICLRYTRIPTTKGMSTEGQKPRFQHQGSWEGRQRIEEGVATIRSVQARKLWQGWLPSMYTGHKKDRVVNVGEMSRSEHVRGWEHVKMYEGEKGGLLYGNFVRKSMMVRFKHFKLIWQRSMAMMRCSDRSESVNMNKVKKDDLMNSKTKWNYFKIPRVVTERRLKH